MNELLFSAMDIPNEALKILKKVEDKICKGMTDTEKEAYNFGVHTILNLLKGLLELDEEPVVHMSGLNEIIEMSIEELEEIFLK